MNLLDGLNQEQKQAVLSNSLVTVINAGPGTGKTKTLISRIGYLILEKNIDPSSILAITFTKKAATEMKERLQKYSIGKNNPYIGTFHSFAFDVLSREKEIVIVDDKKRNEIIIKILKKTEFKLISKKEAFRTISLYKSRIKSYSDSKSNNDVILEKLVLEYNDSLKANNFFDFDDILLEFYTLLRNPQKLQELQTRFQYILVDEFQDTNEVQYEIIKLLAENKNLFIIGDPLQSIYSFRGAGADMFGQVIHDFPNAESITLPMNYRSGKNIIHVSSLLFPETPPLIPMRKDAGSVFLINTFNEFAEADYIVRTIAKHVGGIDLLHAGSINSPKELVCFSDVAVIYRNHRVSSIIAEKLFNSGIPYQVIGEDTPYHQREIKFLIDCLQFIYNNTDQNRSKLTESAFLKGQMGIDALFEEIKKYSKPSILIQKLVQHFRLLEKVNNEKEETRNMMQFQSSMSRFDAHENGLQALINYLNVLEDHEYYDSASDKVTLLTMHAAKGLEFRNVFIAAFEDGIIPNIRNSSDIEEEKRLLYVAITRAKDSVYLMHASNRNNKNTIVSRFENDILCDSLIKKEDEATIYIKKKIEIAKIKKSQMKMF